jgi:Protein of unknown function, DUF547
VKKFAKCRVADGFLAWPRREGGGNTRSGLVPPEQCRPSQKDTQPVGESKKRRSGFVARSVTARCGDAPSREPCHTAFLARARRFLILTQVLRVNENRLLSVNPALQVIITLTLVSSLFAFEGEPVTVPPGINHDVWDGLLARYVDENGLVAYAEWKANQADLKRLDQYLAQFAQTPATPATGDDEAASLINLYNALTVRTILENYLTDSIQSLAKPFDTKRLKVGGRDVSLDDIEHGALRPLMGYRAHAVLVCAARNCPPLQRFAYRADKLNAQIDTAYLAWLGRHDLNRFLPGEKKIEISSIFNWFKTDFDKAGGTKKILAQHAPGNVRSFLASDDYEIIYLPYNWGLNDQGSQGKGYSRGRMLWDRFVDFVRFWN